MNLEKVFGRGGRDTVAVADGQHRGIEKMVSMWLMVLWMVGERKGKGVQEHD